jgi:hypothetical protein
MWKGTIRETSFCGLSRVKQLTHELEDVSVDVCHSCSSEMLPWELWSSKNVWLMVQTLQTQSKARFLDIIIALFALSRKKPYLLFLFSNFFHS